MNGHAVFRWAAVVAFALCYVTILLGGNVMASDSGLACPDWPTCHGTFLPALQGPTGVEYAHRLAAGLLGLSIVGLAIAAFRYEQRRPILQRLSYAALGLAVAQALLGGWVVDSNLIVAVVLLHFFLATLLFGLLLVLLGLANLREVPRRWLDWAWRATDERARPRADSPDSSLPAPDPAPGVPGDAAR